MFYLFCSSVFSVGKHIEESLPEKNGGSPSLDLSSFSYLKKILLSLFVLIKGKFGNELPCTWTLVLTAYCCLLYISISKINWHVFFFFLGMCGILCTKVRRGCLDRDCKVSRRKMSGETWAGESMVPSHDHGREHMEICLLTRPTGPSTWRSCLQLDPAICFRFRYLFLLSHPTLT